MKYSLLLIITLSILVFAGCKDDEASTSIVTIPCIDEHQEPLYKIQIKNSEFHPICYAFLSTKEGEIVHTKKIDASVTTIEDYCGYSTTYHLTTFTKEYNEQLDLTSFYFKTYLNIPNDAFINLSNQGNGSVIYTFDAHITIDSAESVQKVVFNKEYSINEFFTLAPNHFFSQSINMPRDQKYYTQIWANNQQPRFCFYQSSEGGNNGLNLYDYNDLVQIQDTVRIELNADTKWRYSIDGVINVNPVKLVEIDSHKDILLDSDHITTYLPSSEFNLRGYFFYLSGRPEPYHIKFYKFLEEVPMQIAPKEFTITPITRNTESISFETIEGADVLWFGWLNDTDIHTSINWIVQGPSSKFSFTKPLIPNEIIDGFSPKLNNIEWGLGKGFYLYSYDNIHTYGDYLNTFYGENRNPNRFFLSSTEEYIGQIE